MQIPKPSDEDKLFFRSIVPESPDVQVKPMFGNLGAFVNGNMFAGLFGSSIGVRLTDEESRRELESVQGIGPFGPSERPMSGYIAVPPAWAEEPGLISHWVERALSEVGQLPPKQPKRRS